MPIRINLLAEQLAAEEIRKRDPVKRAYWIAGALVGLVLVYTGLLQVRVSRAASELLAENAKWKALETRYNQVQKDFTRTTVIEAQLDALDRLSINRFLWGNSLSALQLTVLAGVEVTKLTGRQTFEFVEPIPTKIVKSGGVTNVIPGKLGSSRQTLRMAIKGMDLSPVAGSQIIPYRDALLASPYFSSELKKSKVAFVEQSSPQLDPATKRMYIDFTLEIQFQEALRTNRMILFR